MGTQDLRALGTLAASFLRHISCEVVRRMSNANLEATLRWASAGTWLTLAGALLSGPISLVLVNATHSQPPWHDSATFVRHYHPIQTLPFFLGFLLVTGLVVMTASLSLLAKPEQRARVTVAVALISAFSALVFLNYIVQTTFVPLLVRDHGSANAPLVAALTMSNPNSLGWCLEMWAYALAGVATWLSAVVFEGGKLEMAARFVFTANGPTSIASALATAFIPGWALTTAGLVAFGAWNLLLVAMCALALLVLRARRIRAT
jgi:hypothetical protein